MADKKLNEVTANATVDYVIGTLNDGSTVRISKANLATVVLGEAGLRVMNANMNGSTSSYLHIGTLASTNSRLTIIGGGSRYTNSVSQPGVLEVVVYNGTLDYKYLGSTGSFYYKKNGSNYEIYSVGSLFTDHRIIILNSTGFTAVNAIETPTGLTQFTTK